MTARRYWIPWLFFGIVVGGGIWAPGIAFFVAIAALGSLSVLALLRVPGFWIGVAGVGIGYTAAQSLLILSPNAPEEALWPLVVGIAIAAVGMTMSRLRRDHARTAGR